MKVLASQTNVLVAVLAPGNRQAILSRVTLVEVWLLVLVVKSFEFRRAAQVVIGIKADVEGRIGGEDEGWQLIFGLEDCAGGCIRNLFEKQIVINFLF